MAVAGEAAAVDVKEGVKEDMGYMDRLWTLYGPSNGPLWTPVWTYALYGPPSGCMCPRAGPLLL